MSTAWVYPGLNALLRQPDRTRYLGLPQVQACFKRGERLLKRELGLDVDFSALMGRSTEEIYNLRHISLTAVAVCSFQVGVFEALTERGLKPDWLMGCSLGDLARSVCAEVCDFETALLQFVRFSRSTDGIDQIGGNLGVSSLTPFTSEDLNWFSEQAMDVSIMTPRFLNVGGRFSDLERLEAEAKSRRWRTVRLLNYPAHSRYIIPYVAAARADINEVTVHTPKIPIFSSLSCRVLDRQEDIRDEVVLNMTQTIRWYESVMALIQTHGVTEMINLGPCQTLPKMMRDFETAVPMTDAATLLGL